MIFNFPSHKKIKKLHTLNLIFDESKMSKVVERCYDHIWATSGYYPNLFVRMYHKDEYNDWVVGQIVSKGEVLLSGVSELLSLNGIIDVLFEKYIKEGEIDPESLSEMEVIQIKDQILNQSFPLNSIQGVEEEVTPGHKLFPTLPKKEKESVLSGKRGSLIAIYLTPCEKLVLNSLSLFIQQRMISLCIGSTYIYDSVLPYSRNKNDLYQAVMLAEFLTRIQNMGHCCIGCYINLSQLVPKVDREHLLFRLGEHIASPEITHLLRTFQNISGIQSKDGEPHLYYKTGLIHVAPLAITQFDFDFNEFYFHFRKCGYFYTRLEFDAFIGIPINCLENSSVDIIQHSVENNIKDSLAKINITADAEEDIVSCNFFIVGESIPLFGGELKLISNQFPFEKKKQP